MPETEISGGRPLEIRRGSFAACKRLPSLHFWGMTDEAPFAIQAALRRHFEREAHSQLGVTLQSLIRSDSSRLQFWDGNLVVDDLHIQRKYVEGEAERVVIEAAQLDATLTPCIGYVLVDPQYRPTASAWLIDGDGNLIDPARRVRDSLAYIGVALRLTEAANWTPTQPHAVAERSIGLQPV